MAGATVRVRIVEGATLRHEGSTYYSGAELKVSAQDAEALIAQGVAERYAPLGERRPARPQVRLSEGKTTTTE